VINSRKPDFWSGEKQISG